jgi:hypothetical protein
LGDEEAALFLLPGIARAGALLDVSVVSPLREGVLMVVLVPAPAVVNR